MQRWRIQLFPARLDSKEQMKLVVSLVLPVVMSSVVKLFISQRKLYKKLGLDASAAQSSSSKCLVSGKSLFLLVASTQLFISTTAFFLFKAETVDEYGMSFYISITVLIITIYTSDIAWKMDQISTLMNACEDFIDKSLFFFLNVLT